jgi:hypothetical protein
MNKHAAASLVALLWEHRLKVRRRVAATITPATMGGGMSRPFTTTPGTVGCPMNRSVSAKTAATKAAEHDGLSALPTPVLHCPVQEPPP